MSKFMDRLIIGIILVLALLIITFTNKLVLFFALLFVSTVAVYEMSNVLKKLKYSINLILAYIVNFFIVLFSYLDRSDLVLLTLSFSIMISMALCIFIKGYKMKNQFALAFVSIYISLFFSFLVRLSNKELFIWVFILSWGTDTFAYISGMLFGRHKLTEISPNKTIEGAIGGIIGSLILTLIYCKILNFNQLPKYIFFAILAGVISQLGDISASNIKRKAGIKDYGNILRSHGGILDRFDSVLFIAPLVYLFSVI